MQSLTGTVGELGANARHDAALVQAILVLTQRPADLDPRRSKYLSNIDGDCGDQTKRAIRQFQYDQVFGDPSSKTSRVVAGATAGLVAPGDVTWRKLIAAVPGEYRDLRVLNGSKTVYVAGTHTQRDASAARVRTLTFELNFCAKVVDLINRIHQNYGIVIGVCRDGDRRTFQTQYMLLTTGGHVTQAGPGESNHNFGQAVDLGFEGLRWFRSTGIVVENETSWLHQLDPTQRAIGESLFFWNRLREEGTQIGMHRGPVSDRPHLQAWNDAAIDMADRLANLLTRVGQMRWTGRNQRYQCDLGFGGRFFDVGSAAQIWNRQATITVATLTQARAQAGGQLPGGSGAAPLHGGAPQDRPAVTEADVTAMRESLRSDFNAADTHWRLW